MASLLNLMLSEMELFCGFHQSKTPTSAHAWPPVFTHFLYLPTILYKHENAHILRSSIKQAADALIHALGKAP